MLDDPGNFGLELGGTVIRVRESGINKELDRIVETVKAAILGSSVRCLPALTASDTLPIE